MSHTRNPANDDPRTRHTRTLNTMTRLLRNLDTDREPLIANRHAAGTWALAALEAQPGDYIPDGGHHLDTLDRWRTALEAALERPTIAPHPERANPIRDRIEALEWITARLDTRLTSEATA